MKNKHIGSAFDDFLRDEEILEEVNAGVQKRVIAERFRAAMDDRKMTVSSVARAMKTSRTVVQSLLDPNDHAATLVTLAKAAHAVGRELHVSFEPIERGRVAGASTSSTRSVTKKVAKRKAAKKTAAKAKPSKRRSGAALG
jgi:antitoxin HicB